MEPYLNGLTESKAAALLLSSKEVHNRLYSQNYLDRYMEQVLLHGPEAAANMRKSELRNMLTELSNNPALLKDPRYSTALRVSALAAAEKEPGTERSVRPVLHEMYNAMATSFEEALRRIPEGDDRRAILEQAIGRAKVMSGHSPGGATMDNWPANIASAARVASAAGVNVDAAVSRAIQDSLYRHMDQLVGSTDRLMEIILAQQADKRLAPK